MSLIIKSTMAVNKQRGFTLIELMISMVIGLIILAAAITMFVSMNTSNNDNLKSIRLNQELRAAMSLITRDIRRAGANRNAAADTTATTPTNPYSSLTTGTRLTIPTGGASISFSYDAVDDANTELYGYRRNDTVGSERVELCLGTVAAGCGAWQPLTDESLVNVTVLNFVQTPITVGLITIRQVIVTLTGQLRRDPGVVRTIVETVKIRNEEF